MRLPEMVYSDGISKKTQVRFAGLEVKGADGALVDMKNLTGDEYPALATRKKRRYTTLASCTALGAWEELYYVSGTGFYYGGAQKGTVTAGEKTFAALGRRIVILPDKAYYDVDADEFGSLEVSYSASGLVFGDGTYAGEDAELNSITTTGNIFPFKVGDAVTISGCGIEAHNKTPIIREVSDDGKTLRFYENTFTEAVTEAGTVTLCRKMPDMDFLCANENRLWGCKDDTIYASKLGDATNWNVFDGLETDSFTVDTGSAGRFTAAISYLGYPTFFKEDRIFKVYGSTPSSFEVMSSATLGVAAGSHKSLAVAGEMLFYLSKTGITAYSGGIPSAVSTAFGGIRFKNAVGGSDGTRYYVSMADMSGNYHLYVYNTETKLWHVEDEVQCVDFAFAQGELYFAADGKLWSNTRTTGGTEEGAFAWYAEFADFTEGDANRKGVSKLQLRLQLDAAASCTVKIQFDSDGTWHTVGTLTAQKKRSFYLPIVPRRCDHYRLRLQGTGEGKIYSITRETYSGSEL